MGGPRGDGGVVEERVGKGVFEVEFHQPIPEIDMISLTLNSSYLQLLSLFTIYPNFTRVCLLSS